MGKRFKIERAGGCFAVSYSSSVGAFVTVTPPIFWHERGTIESLNRLDLNPAAIRQAIEQKRFGVWLEAEADPAFDTIFSSLAMVCGSCSGPIAEQSTRWVALQRRDYCLTCGPPLILREVEEQDAEQIAELHPEESEASQPPAKSQTWSPAEHWSAMRAGCNLDGPSDPAHPACTPAQQQIRSRIIRERLAKLESARTLTVCCQTDEDEEAGW